MHLVRCAHLHARADAVNVGSTHEVLALKVHLTTWSVKSDSCYNVLWLCSTQTLWSSRPCTCTSATTSIFLRGRRGVVRLTAKPRYLLLLHRGKEKSNTVTALMPTSRIFSTPPFIVTTFIHLLSHTTWNFWNTLLMRALYWPRLDLESWYLFEGTKLIFLARATVSPMEMHRMVLGAVASWQWNRGEFYPDIQFCV